MLTPVSYSKPTINYIPIEGEVPNLASEEEGLLFPKMSMYFRALLYNALFWEYVRYGKQNSDKTRTKSDRVSPIHIHGCTFGNYRGELDSLFYQGESEDWAGTRPALTHKIRKRLGHEFAPMREEKITSESACGGWRRTHLLGSDRNTYEKQHAH